jgi:hypothetical protein
MGTLYRLKVLLKRLFKLDDKLNANLLLNAKILRKLNNQNTEEILNDISKAEFKVFSQHGDDGIIQFLVDYLNITNKTFVEFGVENYLEANTRYLLIENNWKGLIIDGSKKNMDFVKFDNIYWRHNLTAVHSFVTKENINQLLEQNGFAGEIGLLHIDIDGNDYWVWDAIHVAQPIILILEYNSNFGADNTWTIPYNPQFVRTRAHYSNTYYGASLAALVNLSAKKGYVFIGCNSAGNNAFFVKSEHAKNLKPKTCKEGYVASMFRESRNENGALTYLNKEQQFDLIKGMPVIDTTTMTAGVIK